MLKRFARHTLSAAIAVLALAWAALAPGPARAGQEGSQAPSADTIAVAQKDTSTAASDTVAVIAKALVPTNGTYMRSNENDVSLGSAMSVVYGPATGWLFTNSLTVEQRRYRAREMTDITENLSMQAVRTVPGLYIFGAGVGNNYSKKKTLGLGRYGKDIVYDNELANASFRLIEPQLGATESQLVLSADAKRGTNDFKYDRTVSGGLSGSLLYLLGDLVSAGAGFGTSRRVESSDVGDTTFSRMPSTADTVRASFALGGGDKKLVQAEYRRSVSLERKVMPKLGNYGEILDVPGAEEEARIRQESLALRSHAAPLPFIALDFEFSHLLDDQQYRFDEKRSGKRKKDDMRASVAYNYAKSGSMRFGVQTTDATNDYGLHSNASYDERDYELRGSITQQLLDSLQFNAEGTGRLVQYFYKDKVFNPRDVDRLFYGASGSLRSRFLKRVSVDINGAVERYETINIDATLSGDNRVDYLYRLGPTIRLKPLKWVNLAQDYTLKIEYTDFVFTKDKNYLNRTTTVNTRAEMIPFKKTQLAFRHTYMMRDTGSYLKQAGGDVYAPSNMNVEHTLFFDVTYNILLDFAIKAAADFRHQKNGSYGLQNGRRTIVRSVQYESGGLRLGFLRKKNLGRYGNIDLDIAWVKNYGPNISDERKEFWAVDSAVNLKF